MIAIELPKLLNPRTRGIIRTEGRGSIRFCLDKTTLGEPKGNVGLQTPRHTWRSHRVEVHAKQLYSTSFFAVLALKHRSHFPKVLALEPARIEQLLEVHTKASLWSGV